MGKGDQKSRRGKIVIGSNGVRRPKKNKPKAIVPNASAIKLNVRVEKPKAGSKPTAKVAEPFIVPENDATAAKVKAVKKAVKKTEG